MKKFETVAIYFLVITAIFTSGFTLGENREEKKKKEVEQLQEQFKWWPTDAKPAPVKDELRGGYWWWPVTPGESKPWGNRGFIYVYKIIFDYKEEELPPPKAQEMRPSLLIKKIVKNVKIYFDYDKADLRNDAVSLLDKAVSTLKKDPETSILVTGNCDIRGTEKYNEKLGRKRAESTKNFMLSKGIPEDRIKIVSRGKLDAIAHITDLVGMQKDRNAQFMIAEVEEIMIPYQGEGANIEGQPAGEGKYVVEEEEKVESEVKVATEEYTIQKGDTLWKIAQKKCGSGYRWKYLYELNKGKIKDPDKLKAGQKILIPIE